MRYENVDIINFDNIKTFLQAVALTNEKICIESRSYNGFICYFLATGDNKIFCKEGRKLLKQIEFNELLIDIQSTLLLHDSIKSLTQQSPVIQMYGGDYWNQLYNNMPSTIDNYDDFVKKYKQNFDLVINSNLQAYNIIICYFLEETLSFVETFFSPNQLYDKRQDFEDYSRGMQIVKNLLKEKTNKDGSKNKTLIKNITKKMR